MPSQEDMRPEGRPHFLSDRNVAHSAKDGTAVPFFPTARLKPPPDESCSFVYEISIGYYPLVPDR